MLDVVTGRAWLDVPYDEKDAAKALGARWDPQARRWYAPQPGSPELARWAPLPDIPELLPGEDRAFGSGLFVDLVPSSCWFTNVRSCTTPRDWERLRRMIVGRAEGRCEACGRGEDRDARRWLEAHERWAYDEQAGTQTLRRLLCLCTDCHRVTHFGRAKLHGMAAEALAHLRAVTGMSEDQASAHVGNAYAVWQRRSSRDWALDLEILTGAGIAVVPPQAAERAEIADQALSVTLGVRPRAEADEKPGRPSVTEAGRTGPFADFSGGPGPTGVRFRGPPGAVSRMNSTVATESPLDSGTSTTPWLPGWPRRSRRG